MLMNEIPNTRIDRFGGCVFGTCLGLGDEDLETIKPLQSIVDLQNFISRERFEFFATFLICP